MPTPLDENFWAGEAEILFNILFPLFKASAVDSARSSYAELAGSVDLGISWDVFNQSAIDWAEANTKNVVAQISKTSMSAFLEEYGKWVNSGEPLSTLIESLAPYYGKIRAEMVAVTEVTRAYALGNLTVWQRSGLVDGFNVNTAEDDIVCPICAEERASNPKKLDDDPPPYHVRCRCWITPVL